jgi:hypothetical protein
MINYRRDNTQYCPPPNEASNEPRADQPARKPFRDLVWKQLWPASAAVTVPPSASAVADGGELLGQAAAEGRHEYEEA